MNVNCSKPQHIGSGIVSCMPTVINVMPFKPDRHGPTYLVVGDHYFNPNQARELIKAIEVELKEIVGNETGRRS